MPEEYLAIRDKFHKEGKSMPEAKEIAAKIYNSKHPDNPVTNHSYKKDYSEDVLHASGPVSIPLKNQDLYSGMVGFASNHFQGPGGKFAPNPKNSIKTPAEGPVEIGELPKTGSYMSQISEAELMARAGKLDSNRVYTHKALTQHLRLHPNSSQHAIEKLEKKGFILKHINGFKKAERNLGGKGEYGVNGSNIIPEETFLQQTYTAYPMDSDPYGADTVTYSEEDGGHWVTIGAKNGHGGSPVHIDKAGEIDKGNAKLVGKEPEEIKKENVNKPSSNNINFLQQLGILANPSKKDLHNLWEQGKQDITRSCIIPMTQEELSKEELIRGIVDLSTNTIYAGNGYRSTHYSLSKAIHDTIGDTETEKKVRFSITGDKQVKVLDFSKNKKNEDDALSLVDNILVGNSRQKENKDIHSGLIGEKPKNELKIQPKEISSEKLNTSESENNKNINKNDKKEDKNKENKSENPTSGEKSGIMDESKLLNRAKEAVELASRQLEIAQESANKPRPSKDALGRLTAAKEKKAKADEELQKLTSSEKKPESIETFKNLDNLRSTKFLLDKANSELLPEIHKAVSEIAKNHPEFAPETVKVDVLPNDKVANINKNGLTINYRYVNNPKLTAALLKREFQGQSLSTLLEKYADKKLNAAQPKET